MTVVSWDMEIVMMKVPVRVQLPAETVHTMSCGQFHTIVGCVTGSAYSCGKNDYGQVGLESAENTRTLTKLPAFAEGAMVQQVVRLLPHTCAITNELARGLR